MLRLAAVLALALFARNVKEKPIESAHVAGPNGLEGWTESVTIEEVANQGPLPIALVIAQRGKVLRRIDGSPFVWNCKFQLDGKRVAYETGPLHFGMMCVLADIRTGKQLESLDCYQPPPHMPAWAEELERGNAVGRQ